MTFPPKIVSVSPLPDMLLSVTFDEGTTKHYDVKNLCNEYPEMFHPLIQNPALFEAVSICCGGRGIEWTDDIDLPENELWVNGVTVQQNI